VEKVLVVDDNPPLVDIMRRMLKLMGYDSVSAANGEECLSQAVSIKPDIILLDISLPDLDGRDVARRLRSHPASKGIPILAFTAVFDRSFGESCLAAGCDDYVVKPVTHQILQEKIQTLLGVRRRQ
jgi:CheY-like chemotaxis protein